jgi:uncharacterized membrane protein
MQTSIITQAIEWLLDKLKTKNGVIYAIVMAVLAFVYFALQYISNHPDLGIVIPTNIQDFVNTVLIVLAALTGSHTTAAQDAKQIKNK